MPKYSKRPLSILIDWDGTLTTASTLPTIASIATLPDIHPELARLSAAYSDDLRRYDNAYVPRKQDRSTIQHELAYLSSLKTVERASIERIEASGVFKNVWPADIEFAAAKAFAAGDVTLRGGWNDLLQLVQHDNVIKVAIISVAWSGYFISKVLREADRAAGGLQPAANDILVKANEIFEDGSGRLDRYFSAIGQGIWTAADKAVVMDQLLDDSATSSQEGEEAVEPFTVYIGDSPTDLACLLKADAGICIRDSPLTSEQKALDEMLQRLGVECRHVREGIDITSGLSQTDTANANGSLWWASDFQEIRESELLKQLMLHETS